MGRKGSTENIMNTSRTEILGRIRRSLDHLTREQRPNERPSSKSPKSLFASDFIDSSRIVQRFKEESNRVGGETEICRNIDSALQFIESLIKGSSYRNIAISNHKICVDHQVIQKLSVNLPEITFFKEYIDTEDHLQYLSNTKRLAATDLSITGVECLIADSGTIVLTSNPKTSRQISLLPTAHLVLALTNQIYPNLSTALQYLQSTWSPDRSPTAITLITGPSRTADIEQVLIKGAHGPVRQLALLIEDENKQ